MRVIDIRHILAGHIGANGHLQADLNDLIHKISIVYIPYTFHSTQALFFPSTVTALVVLTAIDVRSVFAPPKANTRFLRYYTEVNDTHNFKICLRLNAKH